MKVVCFDLDDTLYKEIDFLNSAFKEVVSYAFSQTCNGEQNPHEVLTEMLTTYHSGGNAFEFLNKKLGIEIPISLYVEKYRMHKPLISLSQETTLYLNLLRDKGYLLGLITDGRSVQQRNKIEALGLYQYIDNRNIVISEEFGSAKPAESNYKYFMELYPWAQDFVYIGDNVQKDFIAANRLAWKTICLKDNGSNIHEQSFELDKSYLPSQIVDSLLEIYL